MKHAGLLLMIFCLMPGLLIGQVLYRDSLDVNNAVATFYSDGVLFGPNDTVGSNYSDPTITSYYRAPAGGNATVGFAGNLWLGGIDAGGTLHMTAQTYRQTGVDTWPGPLGSNLQTDSATVADWNYIWKITSADVIQHQQDLADNGVIDGPVPAVVLHWPGKGNPDAQGANGQTLNVLQDAAPFQDVNGDGLYTPLQGDFPIIKGDQALWWVFNDSYKAHGETQGLAMGLEYHVMAYAFDCPSDTVLYNTTFLSYDIINRSNTDYFDVFAGMWTDFDMGCFDNDHIGCYPPLDFYFGYNGTAMDPDCANPGHGVNLGTFNVVTLKGLEDTTGNQTGLSAFTYYNNDFSVTGNPEAAIDYYNYMNSIWKDGTPITSDMCDGKGGSVPTTYMFPDEPGGAVFPATWSECSCLNTPSDRRGLGATGKGSLPAGGSIQLEFAYYYHEHGPQAGCAAPLALNEIQYLHDAYAQGLQTVCGSCTSDTCVWPGDANHDGIANNFDILNMGIAAGNTGLPRPGASNNWTGQPGTPWSQSFLNGVNYQHADSDGNGIVDFDDNQALFLNYGFTHYKTDITAEASLVDPRLFVNVGLDTVGINTSLAVPIHLGTSALPASKIYGVALTLNLDTSLIRNNSVAVSYDSSWLGTVGVDMMVVDQFIADGRLEIGMTRSDGQPVSSYGNIVTVNYITTDNLSGKNALAVPMPMYITNVQVTDSIGQIIPVNLGADTIVITDAYNGIGELLMLSDLQLFPNPAQEVLYMQLPDAYLGQSVSISMYNALGKEVETLQQQYLGKQTISTTDLPDGVYFIKVTVAGRQLSKRIMIQ